MLHPIRPLPSNSFFFPSKTKEVSEEVNKKIKSAAIAFYYFQFLLFSPGYCYFFRFPFLDLRFLGSLEVKNLPPIFGLFLSQTAALFIRYIFKNPARYCFCFYGCLYLNFCWRADIIKLIQVLFFEAFYFLLLVKSELDWRLGYFHKFFMMNNKVKFWSSLYFKLQCLNYDFDKKNRFSFKEKCC